ncbi:MAG: 2-oxoglutarate dehydrogenase, E2 component, dihydrolipoamide succinyltransferase, partial [Actinomycetota bacterium]
MSFSVKMPALGESVTEGTVTRWLKAEGDQVALDEPLLEVSTDKVDTEIPSPAAGKLEKILIPVDSVVAVGTELALIGDGASSPSAPVAAAPAPAPVVQAPIVQAPVVQAPVAPVVAVERPVPAPPKTPPPLLPKPAAGSVLDDSYVTPIVRKLASENGVDLSRVSGTGVGGRIRKEDVMAAVSRPTQAAASAAAQTFSAPSEVRTQSVAVSPLRGTTVSMSRLRKVIAARMLESLSVSAQLTTVIEVDITKIARLREKAKATFEGREGVKLTFLPFLAVAVCEALKQHPVVNASVEGDQITYHGAEHLGIAVDTERGLLVPVIRDAGDLNMGGIARRIVDVASRTRDNKISPDDLGGGTFTITNTGSRGALFDTPIINQPQVA